MAGTADLFRALEFAHYAARFRESVMVIGLTGDTPFRNLLLDLKVMAGYRIQAVLVVPDPNYEVERLTAQSNRRGTRFHLSLLTDLAFDPATGAQGLNYDRLAGLLAEGRTPIVAFNAAAGAPPVEPAFVLAAEVAVRLRARKLFLVTGGAAEVVRAMPRPHVLSEELEQVLPELPEGSAPTMSPLLTFIQAQLERDIPDIILMEDGPGRLFREVFTHDGDGVLFNRRDPALIRQARISDVTDIMLLMDEEIEQGRILPISENDIEADVRWYWVYEIDGLLVGSARLKPYGGWGEMAQFATLARYRDKGRARELAQRLEQEARAAGMGHLFALSTDERMWSFFRSLDFAESPREALPEAWRAHYDFSRPSHAFVKVL